MKSSKTWLLAIAAITLSAGVQAADDGYSTTYSAFMDESGGVTINMLDCMGSETEQQDARLNQNYKAAMQSLTPAQQTQLRDAQRLWIKFRDADCDLLGSLTGGSIDRISSASCFMDMTKQRADDLARLAEPSL
ncbi:lysozyme inhibitor LprI family protein [Stutzerimonas chloritidismutans]|uniref:Lysozyme inhibitor LprI family protein n=1 Tax=Stutzerimonas chloritidismutans TaxID=203192 RepID=A0ABU9MEL2_STUCH